MFTRRDFVPLLLNLPREHLSDDYLGPLPSTTFRPIEPSAIVSDALVRQLFGGTSQALAFAGCQMLAVIAQSPLASLLGWTGAELRPESLELRRMYLLSQPSVSDPMVELQAPRPRLIASEYTINVFQLLKLSDSVYQLTRATGQTSQLTENVAGYYTVTVSADAEAALLFKSSQTAFTITWAGMPSTTFTERFASLVTEQKAAIELLSASTQHVLDVSLRKALRSITLSKAAGSLRVCAFLLLVLSHYNYLHDLRG